MVLGELVAQARRRRARPARDVLVTATQADLAQLAGSSRESASRFLAVLERAGVISQGRGPAHRPRPRGAEAVCLLSQPLRLRGRPADPRAGAEFSAGGVVVRGEEVVVIVPTRRAADGSRVLALPKGHVDPGETPVAGRPARGARGDRRSSPSRSASSGETRYWYRRDGRTIGKEVSFFLFELRRRRHRRPRRRGRGGALDRAWSRPNASSATRPSAKWWPRAGPTWPKTGSLPRDAGPELLLDDLRRRAQARPQDGDDPARRQVGQVPQEPGRAGHDRLPVLAARRGSSKR